MNALKKICEQFQFKGEFLDLEPYGDGHINDTYRVSYENEFEETVCYILQRVNHLIFKETEALMENIEKVTAYLSDMVRDVEDNEYEVLTLVKTKDDKPFYLTDDGMYYRAYVFIKDSIGYTFTENTDLLYEGGKAFGNFQVLLKDYPVKALKTTILDFHNTPVRYNRFKTVFEENALSLNETCEEAIQFVLAREKFMPIIMDLMASKDIPWRVTHNDTKLNNVLMSKKTNKGLCVIDLDTVMPGSGLFDFGDAIRSCGSTAAEDEEDLSLLDLDINRFKAFTEGYLSEVRDELTAKEIELLPEAAILMTLECGMRFLTDYLEGDVYFKVHKPQHNLIRARNQFKFVEVMESNLKEMKTIVKKCCE